VSVWEFAVPEGTPLTPAPGGLLRLDPEKARMRALTVYAEDQGDECPACEGTGRGNPLPPLRTGPPPCGVCGGTGRKPTKKAAA
jgi:hypothetical protein